MDGLQDALYRRYESGRWVVVSNAVVREARVLLRVNGREVVSLMCTPLELDALALGWLHHEGIIDGIADVQRLVVSPNRDCVDVWLRKADCILPSHLTITSGFGGGKTFVDLVRGREPLASNLRVTTRQVLQAMQALLDASRLHMEAGGTHSAALARGDALVATTEDVGRHNTMDKLQGRCMLEGISPHDCMLLSTGRVSSEILHKAVGMGVPVVASRNSATGLAVALASAWNVTLLGYVQGDSLNVYAGWKRVLDEDEVATTRSAGSAAGSAAAVPETDSVAEPIFP
jgi:FdhD protein